MINLTEDDIRTLMSIIQLNVDDFEDYKVYNKLKEELIILENNGEVRK